MMRFLKEWMRRDDASAAVESGFILPVMVTILLGTIDIGVGIIVNQKVVGASQQMVDLLTRGRSVTTVLKNDAGTVARLALQPYDTASLGYNIESVYLKDAARTPTLAPCAAPCEAWEDTFNMARNLSVRDTLAAAGYIGEQDDGVIAVTVNYTYTPVFSQVLAGPIEMQEVSFSRGRFGGFITRVYCGGEGEPSC